MWITSKTKNIAYILKTVLNLFIFCFARDFTPNLIMSKTKNKAYILKTVLNLWSDQRILNSNLQNTFEETIATSGSKKTPEFHQAIKRQSSLF